MPVAVGVGVGLTANGAFVPVSDALAPAISNVTATPTGTTVLVEWDTDEPATSRVEYGPDASYGTLTTLDATKVTHHSVLISGQASQTPLFYRVISADAAGNSTTSGGFETATLDVTAPVVSNVLVDNVTIQGFRVSWETSEPATTQLKWGTVNGVYPNQSTLDTVLNTLHSVTVSGLAHSTTYFYRIEAYDSALNLGTATGSQATAVPPDLTAPVISSVLVTPTADGAVVSWLTDEASTSRLEYGTTTAYGTLNTKDTGLVTSHLMTLTGLPAGTLHHLRALSDDVATNAGTGFDVAFTTLGTAATSLGAKLIAEYDATKETLAADGSTVTTPTERVAAAYGLTQSTPADRPIYRLDGDAAYWDFTANNESWVAAFASNVALGLTGDFEVEFVARIPAGQAGTLGLVSRMETDNTDGWSIGFGQGGDGKLSVLCSGASAGTWQNTVSAFNDGQWHRYQLSFVGTNVLVDVDGVNHGTLAVGARTAAAGTGGFRIGNLHTLSSPFVGSLRALTIGNDDATAAESDALGVVHA